MMGIGLGSAHWGYLTVDMTNLYIVQGLHGGVGLMALFILIITVGFRDVGRMVRFFETDRAKKFTGWALGVCLFIHVMNFIGVSYFGQINMIWYMLLASIASLGSLVDMPAPVASRVGGARNRSIGGAKIKLTSAPRRKRPPRLPDSDTTDSGSNASLAQT